MRAASSQLEVTLASGPGAWADGKLPPPPSAEPPERVSQVFRVKCASVELKLTLPLTSLSKSLREAVVVPFLKAYNKKMRRADPEAASLCADDLLRVEVDAMAVSDAVLVHNNLTLVPIELRPDTCPMPAYRAAT
jgi:hypothetical protein